MFKVGDFLHWPGLWHDYWKVIKIDALGFEVIKVSTIIKNERRFIKKSTIKNYYEYNKPHSFKLLTKQEVQDELNTYIDSYNEFMKGLP